MISISISHLKFHILPEILKKLVLQAKFGMEAIFVFSGELKLTLRESKYAN